MNSVAPNLHLVVAMGSDRAIGQTGRMPWYVPEDLKNFQSLTADHILLMGRKTFQSLGRVLKNRPHFVVTSMNEGEFQEMVRAFPNPTNQPVVRCASLDDFVMRLNAYQQEHQCAESVFLIGGAELYRAAIDRHWVSVMTVTEIDACFAAADTFFPEIPKGYLQMESEGPWCHSVSGLRFRVVRYGGAP